MAINYGKGKNDLDYDLDLEGPTSFRPFENTLYSDPKVTYNNLQ